MANYSLDVDPFHETCQTTTNVPVVRAATAVQISVNEMDTSLFNGDLACDAALSICTDPYDAHRQLCTKDSYWGLFAPIVRRCNPVGLQCFKPNHDKVLNTIVYGHCNMIYLDSDINFAPGSVDDTIISASTGVPAWEPDHDYVALAQLSTALIPCYCMEAMVSQVHVDSIYKDDNDTSTLDNKIGVSSIAMKTRHPTVTPERVSNIFGCSLETAKNIINATTQHG
eukprot:14170650-Ditylum_brightwellii.AAC.1